jgi:hypothetical protein
VLIWFAVMSVVLTWLVFQSPALDYRMVALGAVLPVLEIPFGAGPLHSLLAPTVVLALVMLATRGRRLVRRQWLGLPIGMYLHLVLDLSWARSRRSGGRSSASASTGDLLRAGPRGVEPGDGGGGRGDRLVGLPALRARRS